MSIDTPRHLQPVCERTVERSGARGARVWEPDTLAVEAPLELRQDGAPVMVVMRTPGHDAELTRGLLFAEGVLDQGQPLDGMCEPRDLLPAEKGNVLELGLAPGHELVQRSLASSSSCGVCGKRAIADLEVRVAAVDSGLQVSGAVIAELPESLRAAQAGFALTGGLHAAGAFDVRGTLLAVREDVGRHNAVDKVVGWALARGRVPMHDAILCVSGRISFEIVQKAVIAGFPVIVAVSAPTSLAVDLAERFRVTLCGFTRNGAFNIYSHASRID